MTDDETLPPNPDDRGTESLTPPGKHYDSIGPYKILEVLGEGGMGIVYLAEQQTPIRRRVALKVIKPGMDSKQVLARFESERQALAIMNHPCIARVFDAGATELGHPYFVMEHVAGVSITEYCDKHMLSTRERLELFVRVCEAVQHAHNNGIIHRDIKPSNVLVAVQDGQPIPKVIDFGVAKATSQRLTERTLFTDQGVMIGTPEYMSPEQAEMTALDVDARTDVYSLGILLYELLVGALPFDPKFIRQAGLAEMQRIIRESLPPTPSARFSGLGDVATDASRRRRSDVRTLRRTLRGDLDWIVMKALEKDRTRRHATASALAEELTRYLRGERVATASARLASFGWGGVGSTLALGLIPGILGIALAHWDAAIRIEKRYGLDSLFVLRGPHPPPQEVCVVAIDEPSYSVIGGDAKSVWPRGRHADLIRTLRREGAKAVAFDVLFEREGADPQQDAAFSGALAEAGNVVLGSAFEFTEDPVARKVQVVEPYAPFMKAAATTGEVNLPADSDGVIRFMWPMHAGRPSLGLAAYELATGDTSQRTPDARLLDYYGPARSIQTVSIYQALEPATYLPPGYFRGRVVFVGWGRASDLWETRTDGAPKDTFMTPFRGASQPTSGVEVHATIAANLFDSRRINILTPVLEFVLLLALPLLATFALLRLRPVARAMTFLALEALTWGLAYGAFVHWGTWIPLIIPSIVQLPLAYLLVLGRTMRLRREVAQ